MFADGSDMVDVVITDDDPATLSYSFQPRFGPILVDGELGFFGILPIIADAVESATVEATWTLSTGGPDDTADIEGFYVWCR